MGFATLAFILGVQASVGWQQRGVATALLQFTRTSGGLVWVSVMGAVMNLTLAAARAALADALRGVHLVAFFAGATALIVVLFLPDLHFAPQPGPRPAKLG